MKLRPDLKSGTVHIVMTAREAMSLADRLVKAAIQSGGAVEADRQEPTEEKVERREP